MYISDSNAIVVYVIHISHVYTQKDTHTEIIHAYTNSKRDIPLNR